MIHQATNGVRGYGVDALDIALPEFLRTTWVSDAARAAWEPKIRRCAETWQRLEWLAAVEGIRPCAVVTVTAEQLVERGDVGRRGFVHLPLECLGGAGGAVLGGELRYRAVVATLENAHRFRVAFEEGDDVTLGDLLGCPPCCRESFRSAWVDLGLQDPTWPIAQRSTSPHAPEDRDAPGSSTPARTLDIQGPPFGNILWRWIGLRLVPHLPCRADCGSTAEIGSAIAELAGREGLGAEHDCLLEMLQWPVEWSALHGIAEIRTPILKFVVPTDGTKNKYTVRWQGTRRPAESGRGLDFPYAAPARRKVTASPEFQKGLENPIRDFGSRP
ncbi:MAG TPA: hypothetical protein VJP77_00630 [Planctomycetota bacterium]|nr:hypothetical protein [Planctomycetota bacterium]